MTKPDPPTKAALGAVLTGAALVVLGLVVAAGFANFVPRP